MTKNQIREQITPLVVKSAPRPFTTSGNATPYDRMTYKHAVAMVQSEINRDVIRFLYSMPPYDTPEARMECAKRNGLISGEQT